MYKLTIWQINVLTLFVIGKLYQITNGDIMQRLPLIYPQQLDAHRSCVPTICIQMENQHQRANTLEMNEVIDTAASTTHL